MNNLKSNARKSIILAAMILGAVVTAFAQQEVDPTWFDPWAPPASTVAAQAKPKVVTHKNRAKASAASTQKTARVRTKHTMTQARA